MINIAFWWVIYIFAMSLISTIWVKYIKLKFDIRKNEDSLTLYWFIFSLVFFVVITKYFLSVGIVTY